MQITGNQVRGFREARNLSISKLASMLGIHKITVANWEAREERPIPQTGVDRFRGWLKAQKEGVPYNPPMLKPGRPRAYTKPEIALEDALEAAK